MTEVIFRLPSKKVQYGYAEIKFDLRDEEGQLYPPEHLGAMYTSYFARFVEGEINGVEQVKEQLTQAEATQMLKDTLGATEVTEGEAKPWDKAAKTEDKPWEASASADDDWDL